VRANPRPSVFVAALLMLSSGCWGHSAQSAPSPKQWVPIPAYAAGLDAGAGTICGHGVDSPRAPEATTAVDVLIDSLGRSEFNELPVTLLPLPEWQQSRPNPVIGVTLIYPRSGAVTMRESWSECGARAGATIRVNAATIGRAALAISTTGPVRVTVRAMDGRPLATPIVLAPPSSRVLLRWALRSPAT
jgi:hypothetical protein